MPDDFLAVRNLLLLLSGWQLVLAVLTVPLIIPSNRPHPPPIKQCRPTRGAQIHEKALIDPEADAAYFEISPASVATTREIEPGILGDYDAAGHLVGLEVLSIRARARLPELDELDEAA